ncbi:MAG: M15 family metallopeptidase [Gammaproteobacteria bacterium]|nr:M15 family metallopeptidase [Gammaproteobacteria bacterium]
MASRSLDDLRAELRPAVDAWLQDCAKAGLDILVYCTLRSFEEQAREYAKGRTTPGLPCTHAGKTRVIGTCEQHPLGLIVTKAKPGQSAHQYGLALDFVPLQNGRAQWQNAAAYGLAIQLAEARGLQSLRPFESAHLQHPNWKSIANLGG